MIWKEQERRRYTRAIFPCKIVVSCPKQLLVSHTENIGEGGLRVFLEDRLEPLSIVDLKIFVKKESPIKCKGKVVWVAEMLEPIDNQPLLFDTGIEFTEMDDTGRKYMEKLVDVILAKEKIYKTKP